MVKPGKLRSLGYAVLGFFIIVLLWNGVKQASAQSQDQLQLGAQLFSENCAVCHGVSGEGRVGATLAKNWPSIRPELTVRTIIEQGVPGSPMPAWGKIFGGPLTEEQINALLVYILSWQTGGVPNLTPLPTATLHPPITPVPNVVGDPNQGAVVFAQNCVMCHGASGEGRSGAVLAKDWPSVRPDLTIKTSIENGIPGSRMPAWGQANGGPLSEQEIDDTVAYVMALPPVNVVQPTEPPSTLVDIPWMRGWGGVLLFVVLFLVIVLAAILLQRKKET